MSGRGHLRGHRGTEKRTLRRAAGRTASTLALCLLASGMGGPGLRAQAPSSTASTSSDPPPSAPAVVTATALSSSEVLVEWTPVTDAEGGVKHYKVYRNGTHVGSPTAISFTDSGLKPSTKYTYKVSAVDSKNREGEKSEPVSVTTLPGDDDDDDDDDDGDDTPPTKPQNLQADAVGPRQVDLAWDAASDPESGVASYRVYRDGAAIASPSGTSFSDTGVDPETTYTYRVSAVNGEGLEGPKSDAATVTTPAEDGGGGDGGDDTPPTKPQGLQADPVGPRQVDLAWQAASDPESGVASYRVYRDGAAIASPSGTSFSDTGVDPETTYTYRVSAVNGEGLEGPKSDAATVTTPAEDGGDGGGDDGDDGDSTPPTQPRNLEADVVGPRRVDLAWTAASDLQSGVAFYNVYRDGRVVGTPAGNTFSDTGVEPEASYTYRVSAVNGEGLESRRSDPATATTPALTDTTPPAPPTALRIMNVRSGSP